MAAQVDLSCKLRSNGTNLDCQFLGKERTVMHPEDIPKVIDSVADGIYITAKSRKNLERVFYVDPRSAQFKHLEDMRGSAPMSEISSARVAVFSEIEKRVIKLMDELDVAVGIRRSCLYLIPRSPSRNSNVKIASWWRSSRLLSGKQRESLYFDARI